MFYPVRSLKTHFRLQLKNMQSRALQRRCCEARDEAGRPWLDPGRFSFLSTTRAQNDPSSGLSLSNDSSLLGNALKVRTEDDKERRAVFSECAEVA